MPAVNFQHWLDRVGQSFFDRDFALYNDAVLLPLTVATRDETHIVSDEAQLLQGFTSWIDMMAGFGVDAMIRTSRNVEPLGPDLIVGRYETELLRGGKRVVEPFASSMQLLRGADGKWRCFSVASGFGAASGWPMDRPK